MKRIHVIHTVRPGYLRFGNEITAAIPDAVVTNTLDDELAREAVERGVSPHLRNRFFYAAKLAETTDPDLVVCACTSLIPMIDEIRPFIGVPMILIDDEMHRCAVRMGQNVAVLGSAESAVRPTVEKFRQNLAEQNAGSREIREYICPGANALMREGKMEEHDRLILDTAKQIQGADVVILAQYSLTHLTERLSEICGCPVMGSGQYCIREIERFFKEKEGRL